MGDYIKAMMTQFEAKHLLHMKLYGEGNEKRLTGHHETSSFTKFSYGAGNIAASFRIPTSTAAANGKGYIEDRLPGSNIDPYIVGAVILSTSCLNGSGVEPMVEHYDKWTTFIAEQGTSIE